MRTYLAGVIGAAAMSTAAMAGRRFGIPVDLEILMGTVLDSRPGPRAWRVGLMAQLATGGVLAYSYRQVFSTLRIRPTARVGAVLGFAHGVGAGIALALTPSLHPRVPKQVPSPGPFMVNGGGSAVALFLGMHSLFGIVVARLILVDLD